MVGWFLFVFPVDVVDSLLVVWGSFCWFGGRCLGWGWVVWFVRMPGWVWRRVTPAGTGFCGVS